MNNTFCILKRQDNTERSCNDLNTSRNIFGMETWQSRAKARMKSKKITQEKLAEMLGVTQGAVGHWLSGRRDAGIDVAMSIAECLDMSVGEMLSGLKLKSTPTFSGEGTSKETALDLRLPLPKISPETFTLPTVKLAAEKNTSSEILMIDEAHEANLIEEIHAREIPAHIEQAIMALLQTCEKTKTATPPAPYFTEAEQRKHMENLRNKLSPDVRQQFDGWLEFVRTDGKHGLPSTSNFVAGADQLPTSGDLPAGKTASS